MNNEINLILFINASMYVYMHVFIVYLLLFTVNVCL